MPVKDYYKILEVPPTAPLQEIKKAYRKLAHQYHPDKNSGNPAAEAYFREVMEAYQVLSNHVQRETYNYQRWHQRIKGKKYDTLAFSPQTILSESILLREYIATLDVFRMNQHALDNQIRKVLSDHNLSILQQFNDIDVNRQIVHELLEAARPLHYTFIEPLGQRLMVLAGADTKAVDDIKKYIQQSRRYSQWNKYKIALIVLVTFILCLLIYLLGG